MSVRQIGVQVCFLTLILSFNIGNTVYAQQSVSGVVTDGQSEQTLPGVNILVKGTATGTSTDNEGNYALEVPSLQDTLVFSFVGYQTQQVPINGRTTINISLETQAISGEEMVVVGYGTQQREDLTGSVASVNSEDITQVPTTSIGKALQGRAAGVRANQPSGEPGRAAIIRVRGEASISGGNEPLYVVDGLPVGNIGSGLNPENIESIEILKDASATAIYGSRGANGVVLITTKRGSAGETKVNYHGYYGVQKLRKKFDLLDSRGYAKMVNETAANEEKPPVYSDSEISNLSNSDWQDLVYREAPKQSHQISVSGGNKTTRFYTSLNYLNEEGIIRNSGFERLSFRANLDHDISEKVDLKSSFTINRSTLENTNDEGADGGGAIPWTSVVMPPISPIKDENGDYTTFSGVPWGGTNPVGMSMGDKDTQDETRIIGNIELTYDIVNNLNFTTNLGLDYSNNSNDSYTDIGIVTGGPTEGQASKSFGKTTHIVNENTLSYSKVIENHSIDVLTGFTYEKNRSENLSASGTGFVSDIFETYALESANDQGTSYSGLTESRLISFLGRINYVYDERYLLTVTGRYDGSSRFGSNNKWAVFPSAALGWRISNEPFFSQIGAVNNLKLRISYGKTGNQAISPYQTLARVGTNQPIFGNGQNTGFVLQSMGNVDLQWETTISKDVGLDVGLFDDRIALSADYYINNTENLLFNATLPPSSGFSSSIRNVGEIENKGFEFGLNTKNMVGKFSWSSNLNMSFNRKKILSLGMDGRGNPIQRVDAPSAGGNWFPLFLGESGQQLYGFVIEGIYETDQAADENGEPNKTAGQYRFKDIDGNGIINSEDKTIISDLEPDFTFGFNNTFSYKNFDLSVFIVGDVGKDLVNEFAKYYKGLGNSWNVLEEAWENRWTGPGSGGTYAKPLASTPIQSAPPNSLWVENGSYLQFRDITFSYNFPNSLLNSAGLRNLKLYLSGQNLITITKYSGYGPEASWASAPVNGWDRGVYPSTKSVTIGIKANF